MNTNIKKLIALICNLATVCALAFAGLLLPAPVLAAPTAQQSTPTPRFGDGKRLELMCRNLGRMLEGQQDRLNFANEVAADSEAWLAEQKAKGKDVSALEAALSTYKSALASTQTQLDEAQSAYATQAGFDGNCKLTDRDQAKTTLQSVGDSLREAQRSLADAGRTFRRAVQEWRRANRPAKPTATPNA